MRYHIIHFTLKSANPYIFDANNDVWVEPIDGGFGETFWFSIKFLAHFKNVYEDLNILNKYKKNLRLFQLCSHSHFF